MQTRREYAISLGLAQPTRGRMSRDANAAIAKAEAEGVKFADTQYYAVVKPRKEGTLPKPEKKAKAVVIDAKNTAPTIQHNDADALFYGEFNGKKVVANARQICYNSGVSITGCPCGDTGHLTGTASYVHKKDGRMIPVGSRVVVRLPKE